MMICVYIYIYIYIHICFSVEFFEFIPLCSREPSRPSMPCLRDLSLVRRPEAQLPWNPWWLLGMNSHQKPPAPELESI